MVSFIILLLVDSVEEVDFNYLHQNQKIDEK
jgi:hypothetical protein